MHCISITSNFLFSKLFPCCLSKSMVYSLIITDTTAQLYFSHHLNLYSVFPLLSLVISKPLEKMCSIYSV